MATQEPALPFAIDADITPLQARYFESAQRNIGDPRARMQTYDLIKRSFGGLQAAREAVAAREAQAAERAAADEFNRLRLEAGRFDLLNAREKAAREKAQAEQFRNFATGMQKVASDPTRSAEDRYREISNMAATAATAGVDVAPLYRYNTAQIFGKPVREPGEDKPRYTASDVESLIEGGRSAQDLAAAGIEPMKIEAAQNRVNAKAAEKEAAQRKEGIALLQQFTKGKDLSDLYNSAVATTKVAGSKTDKYSEEAKLVSDVNALAIQMDAVGALTKEDKVALYEAGYAPFKDIPGATRGTWRDDKNQLKRQQLVSDLFSRAKAGIIPGGAAPAAKPASALRGGGR